MERRARCSRPSIHTPQIQETIMATTFKYQCIIGQGRIEKPAYRMSQIEFMSVGMKSTPQSLPQIRVHISRRSRDRVVPDHHQQGQRQDKQHAIKQQHDLDGCEAREAACTTRCCGGIVDWIHQRASRDGLFARDGDTSVEGGCVGRMSCVVYLAATCRVAG